MRTRPWTAAPSVALLLLAPALVPASAAAQTALSLGSFAAARVPSDGSAELVFQATEAGFLTVVARSTGGEDITLALTDEEYQTLPDAESDIDAGGNVGAEQMVVQIPHPGTYRVLIDTFGGGGAGVQVAGSFLASQMAFADPDPDGRPSIATALEVSDTHEDSIDPVAGDLWDWYRITVSQAGALTVLTRCDGDGDLKLELFEDGSYREPANSSDQDIGGVLGNESITWDVQAGSTVYLRVSPTTLSSGDRVAYRITSGLIPG